MAGEHFFLELEPPEERLRKAPHVVVVGGDPFGPERVLQLVPNWVSQVYIAIGALVPFLTCYGI